MKISEESRYFLNFFGATRMKGKAQTLLLKSFHPGDVKGKGPGSKGKHRAQIHNGTDVKTDKEKRHLGRLS